MAHSADLIAGVDGCPGGWIAAFARGDDIAIAVWSCFADALAQSPALIAVDMPIGLPARAGHGGRAAENAVRPLLGARQSSVFSVPSRQAVYAGSYDAACGVALATSDPPRKVSKQLYNITPKIREVDTALRADAALVPRVFEAHPELAFWRMNADRALDQPKKVRGRCHEPGLALRQALLIGAGLPREAVHSAAPKGAGPDDVLDALACLWVARRIACGEARPFPNPPEHDAFGLPMAIWA